MISADTCSLTKFLRTPKTNVFSTVVLDMHFVPHPRFGYMYTLSSSLFYYEITQVLLFVKVIFACGGYVSILVMKVLAILVRDR